MVRVAIVNRLVHRILKAATISLVDMISNVGGILGLFTGLSVISLIELAYWMGSFIASRRTFQDKVR